MPSFHCLEIKFWDRGCWAPAQDCPCLGSPRIAEQRAWAPRDLPGLSWVTPAGKSAEVNILAKRRHHYHLTHTSSRRTAIWVSSFLAWSKVSAGCLGADCAKTWLLAFELLRPRKPSPRTPFFAPPVAASGVAGLFEFSSPVSPSSSSETAHL